jgi:intracellular sulfur oxidation DsrE/DsrF family protein
MPRRRDFLTHLGALATVGAFDAAEMRAAAAPGEAPWDTSWIDKLSSAQFRVVFNADQVSDGAAADYAATFFNDYHEVHATADGQTRPVIVCRRLGTPLALNDALWERYAVGEDTKITDSATRAPAKRNIFQNKLEALQQRGLIILVCNIALGNWSARAAQRTNRKADDVRAEARANLIPGAILVPSGIYALIRAQNAGCAYMPGD